MNLNVLRHLINQHVKLFSAEHPSGSDAQLQLLSDAIRASAWVA